MWANPNPITALPTLGFTLRSAYPVPVTTVPNTVGTNPSRILHTPYTPIKVDFGPMLVCEPITLSIPKPLIMVLD